MKISGPSLPLGSSYQTWEVEAKGIKKATPGFNPTETVGVRESSRHPASVRRRLLSSSAILVPRIVYRRTWSYMGGGPLKTWATCF